MTDLTDRQREVLTEIQRSIRERGYPPTVRELRTKLQISSTNSVTDHLVRLEAKGYILRPKERQARGIQLTAKGRGDGALPKDAGAVEQLPDLDAIQSAMVALVKARNWGALAALAGALRAPGKLAGGVAGGGMAEDVGALHARNLAALTRCGKEAARGERFVDLDGPLGHGCRGGTLGGWDPEVP